MAHFERFGSYLILALTPKERLFALHASPQAKFSDVISVRKVKKIWSRKIMKGVRAPGTGFYRLFALGTWRYLRGKNFLAVHGRRSGYVVTFNSGPFKQWVVTPDNTDEEMRQMFPGFLSNV